jgi:erythronate-4-phosphate dehydrogenase
MRILADASLPGLDNAFPSPFILTRYSNSNELSSLLDKQDILLCRSTLKVNNNLLKTHQLKYVATASSGTDHLDHIFLKEQGIGVVDAKGSNAPSVADYVMSCIAYLDQQDLLKGKKVGIIGMGEVGKKVSMRLKAANFHLVHYDPLKARNESLFQSCELETLYEVDLLCIHAELHAEAPYPSANLIDKTFLDQLKPGCVIINAARGGIVNEEALLNAHPSLIYCTDVYLNEPAIDKRIVDKATICTPHIAGHSIEAKLAAVTLISKKLHQFLELPIPQFASTAPMQIIQLQDIKTWQELVLSIYKPSHETLLLKLAKNKDLAFLKLRTSHNKRHDFSMYADSISNQKTRLLLGR